MSGDETLWEEIHMACRHPRAPATALVISLLVFLGLAAFGVLAATGALHWLRVLGLSR